MKRKYFLIITIVAMIGIILISGCVSQTTPPQEPNQTKEIEIDIDGFKELARNAFCAGDTNSLFIIDNKYVFWHRSSKSCIDASYNLELYGKNKNEILCSLADNIAGPRKGCKNEDLLDFFNIITKNADEPNLGLNSSHSVNKIEI